MGKTRGIKDCVWNERKSRVPALALLEKERSHITKAEIRQRRSEQAERREQERGLFLAVRIGRQKLLEATPLHAAQLAAVGSSSSRL